MKRITQLLILAIMVSLLASLQPLYAQPVPPQVTSQAAVLMDQQTGKIIYTKNENERWAPASLTKIMTMYLAWEQVKKGGISLEDEVPISEKAWRTGGSKMFIEVDTRVPVEELFKGITIVSGNDACVAIAEYLGGTETQFVQEMNEKAKELGMENTHFVNPHGWPDPDHFSTARDVAFLARNYLTSFPDALKYHSTNEFEYNGIRQPNRNGLLKYPEVDGLKTGYVSGTYNLIGTGGQDGYRLIAVVLGAANEQERETDAYALLTYGFNNYQAQKLGDKGQDYGQVRVYKGRGKKVEAVLPEDLVVTTLKGEVPEVEAELPKYLEAPLAEGEQIGELVVKTRDGENRYALVAGREVPKSNFLKVFFHSIWLAVRNLFG